MIAKIINKYKTFIKYMFSAGISFFIDITLFTIFLFLLKKVLLSNMRMEKYYKRYFFIYISFYYKC